MVISLYIYYFIYGKWHLLHYTEQFIQFKHAFHWGVHCAHRVCTAHTVLWSRDTLSHIRDGPQNISNPFEFCTELCFTMKEIKHRKCLDTLTIINNDYEQQVMRCLICPALNTLNNALILRYFNRT